MAAYERAIGKQYPWSSKSRARARNADAVAHAGDIAAGAPALLIIQGTGDTMLTPEPAQQLRTALAPHYANRIPLALDLIDGMPHNVVDGDDPARVRESVAGWFNTNLRDRTGS